MKTFAEMIIYFAAPTVWVFYTLHNDKAAMW